MGTIMQRNIVQPSAGKYPSDSHSYIAKSGKQKEASEEQKKVPAEAEFKFKGKALLKNNGTELHLTPLAELVGDVCLSFHDVCRFSRVVGYEPIKDLAYFVDARAPQTLDFCKRAIYDYLAGYIHSDCTTLYHMPAKLIAGGFLAIFDEMAVQCEYRKPNRSLTINQNDADSTPVLLLQKEGDRQYFYVQGHYDAKLLPTTVNSWRREEKNEPVKQFSYLGSSYYSVIKIS